MYRYERTKISGGRSALGCELIILAILNTLDKGGKERRGRNIALFLHVRYDTSISESSVRKKWGREEPTFRATAASHGVSRMLFTRGRHSANSRWNPAPGNQDGTKRSHGNV